MRLILNIFVLKFLLETVVCSSIPLIKIVDTSGEINAVFNNKLIASFSKSDDGIQQQCDTSESEQCFMFGSNQRLEINETRDYFNNNSIQCSKAAFINFPNTKEVCFKNLASNTSIQWYGAGTDNYWNLIKSSSRPRSPYYTGDAYGGTRGESVIEPVWISSSGIGIYVDPYSPLFMHYDNTNNGSLCFSASYDEFPFNSSDSKPNPKVLSWIVCQAPDVQQMSLYALNNWFDKPSDIPDETILAKPIWSTKSLPEQIYGKMNQTKVIEFAKQITNHNFSKSQIEIGVGWQECVGDWDFDNNSYPNPKQMVEQLKQLGFRLTLWLNGAVSTSCTEVYDDGIKNRYFVELGKTGKPAIDPKRNWTFIDFTNPSAQMWFNQKLQYLNSQYGINSFNFDDGEISPWIIPGFRLFNQTVQQHNPSYYSKYYVESTHKTAGNDIEVRVGFKTQNLPVFVRMLGKDSSWKSGNGIKSVITNALLFSLYGYPFILPDVIGGNTAEELPDKDLYIRWVQVSALLPSMQFSIPPWIYNDSQVLNVSIKMAQLHETFSSTFQDLAQQSVSYGFPIIRPIWWNNPNDQNAFTIDDQFMIGDETLVAPVITANATQRDIYLPTGNWIDENLGQFQVGPIWLRNYSASLDTLPYFRKGQCNPCMQAIK